MPNVVKSNVTPLANRDFTPQDLALIKRTVAADCNDNEFNLFVSYCRSLQLDPRRKQIYALVYSKDDTKKRKMSIIVGIDGFRSIAARTGNYRPDDEGPRFATDPALKSPTNPAGIISVTVKVWQHSHGQWFPVSATAYWDEFAPVKEEWARDETGTRRPTGKKTLDGKWPQMPHLMLAKCFDHETEVLTANGFQRFADVDAPILQVTDAGLEPVAATPFWQAYSGDMVTLDSDDLNFCVTPNHDMVTTCGKIEAGEMFERSRTRPVFHIPRVSPARSTDADISDRAIILSAAYLCDGSDISGSSFRISVSLERKVRRLREVGGYESVGERDCAGDVAYTDARSITTRSNKHVFRYPFRRMCGLADVGKTIDRELLLSLSQRQARLFVDTMIDFDGHRRKVGTARFYTSRPDHASAFEVAALIAGYTVSPRYYRASDIGTVANIVIAISARNAIPVVRWGRDYHNLSENNKAGRTGLTLTKNSGGVWCVTVPSGVIVVRRKGFAMLCGNCAEAQALRKAWPDNFSAVYAPEEMDQASAEILDPIEAVQQAEQQERIAKIGGGRSILFDFLENNKPLEPVPLGQIGDRISAFIKDHAEEPSQIQLFADRNRHGLREYWSYAPGEALEIKKAMEKAVEAANEGAAE